MKIYTPVSRKTVGEDRVAICPKFGCEYIARVKPLKRKFLGFGKCPKCKKHNISLVYIDERIGDFVDAALACLFDKGGLPPKELLREIKLKFPEEFPSFIDGWVYCITKGRGAPILSRYMDTISNAYLKKLTKKQIKSLKKENSSKNKLVNNAIKNGIDEIAMQYTRVLKHLRFHSMFLNDSQKLKSPSNSLRNYLTDWQKKVIDYNEIINSPENKRKMSLKQIKDNYDEILNIGICRFFLGMEVEGKDLENAKISAFDRFSAYNEFYNEGLTKKFTKSDVINLKNINIINPSLEKINNILEKIAEKYNVTILTPYKSLENNISFRCKKCNQEFNDIYKNIKRRKEPKIACPYCFPGLRPNINIPKELREKIAKYTLIELRKTSLHNLSEKEISEKIFLISEFVFRQIDFKKLKGLDERIQEDTKFKRYINRYIQLIVKFLIKIKLLNETKQKINITKVAKETYDKKLISLNSWLAISIRIIRYLRECLDFDIRTRYHEKLEKSAQMSIRKYKTLYKLINDITITYLNKELQKKIKIHYDGRCQGENGICQFNVNYRFLPSLSHHHLLKNYKSLVTSKEFKYVLPHTILNLTFDRAIKLKQTQIGGLNLICMNCHFSKHSIIYNFSPIFTFLQTLSIERINENPSNVFSSIKSLINLYYDYKKGDFKMSKKYTQAQHKAMIKDSVRKSTLALIKKKYVIQFLFGNDYVCPICGRANINEHLNCFVAHHTNEDLFKEDFEKTVFGIEYKKKDVDWLIENLIIEECVFICLNCHQMVHAVNFREHPLTILKSKTDETLIRKYYNNLDRQVSVLRDRILIFKKKIENNSIQIPNPLKLIFEKGDGLKKYLICIYYICEVFPKNKENTFFTTGELNFIFKKERSFRNFKQKLLNLDFIQTAEKFQRIYQITPKGKKKAKELINHKLKDFPKRFRDLIGIWENIYLEYLKKMEENDFYFGKGIL